MSYKKIKLIGALLCGVGLITFTLSAVWELQLTKMGLSPITFLPVAGGIFLLGLVCLYASPHFGDHEED